MRKTAKAAPPAIPTLGEAIINTSSIDIPEPKQVKTRKPRVPKTPAPEVVVAPAHTFTDDVLVALTADGGSATAKILATTHNWEAVRVHGAFLTLRARGLAGYADKVCTLNGATPMKLEPKPKKSRGKAKTPAPVEAAPVEAAPVEQKKRKGRKTKAATAATTPNADLLG